MKKNKSMCIGCRDDFYNSREKKGCWSFGSAKQAQRVEVGTWDEPAAKRGRMVKVLSCYNQSGRHFLNPTDGYAKSHLRSN